MHGIVRDRTTTACAGCRARRGPTRSVSHRPQTSTVDLVQSWVSSDAGCLSIGSVAGLRGRQEMAFPAPLCAELLDGVCLVFELRCCATSMETTKITP